MRILFISVFLLGVTSCVVVDDTYVFNRNVDEFDKKENEESSSIQKPIVFENEPRALMSKKTTLYNGKRTSFYKYIPTKNLREKAYFTTIPHLIKDLISNESLLFKYRENLFYSWSRLNITIRPVGFRYNWQTNRWEYDNGVKELYNSKSARAELFKYIVDIYKSISKNYPIYVIKEFDSRLTKADEFLKQYSKNRSNYLKSQNLVYEIGEDFAWLFRRIENNNVSVNEMRTYILSLKTLIESQIDRNVSNVDCLSKTVINNELLIYDAHNSVILQIPNGNKVIINAPSISILKRDYYYEVSYNDKSFGRLVKKYDSELNEL